MTNEARPDAAPVWPIMGFMAPKEIDFSAGNLLTVFFWLGKNSMSASDSTVSSFLYPLPWDYMWVMDSGDKLESLKHRFKDKA